MTTSVDKVTAEYTLNREIEKVKAVRDLVKIGGQGALETLTESTAWTLRNSVLLGDGKLYRPGKSDLEHDRQVTMVMEQLGLIGSDEKITRKGHEIYLGLTNEGFYAREWD